MDDVKIFEDNLEDTLELNLDIPDYNLDEEEILEFLEDTTESEMSDVVEEEINNE